MPDLSASQLKDIREIITEPLQETINAQMTAGQQSLGSKIDTLYGKLASHIETQASATAQNDERFKRIERRLFEVEERMGSMERFKVRMHLIYSGLALLLSFGFTFAREWVRSLVPAWKARP